MDRATVIFLTAVTLFTCWFIYQSWRNPEEEKKTEKRYTRTFDPKKMDEHDKRAVKLREERERREADYERKERKRMVREWEKVRREYEMEERRKRK